MRQFPVTVMPPTSTDIYCVACGSLFSHRLYQDDLWGESTPQSHNIKKVGKTKMNHPQSNAGMGQSSSEGLQSATKQRKKKPRHKKKKRLLEDDIESTLKDKDVPAKPGKKRLRKLGYQKRTLDRVDFLPVFAQHFAFTRSVKVQTDSAHQEAEHQAPATDKGRSKSLKIVTTGRLPDIHLSSEPNSTFRIFVQPLLILDMNGVLCHRVRKSNRSEPVLDGYRPSISSIAKTPIIPRTDLDYFLRCLDQHFCLAIWTSAKKKTASKLVKALIPKDIESRLIFVWSQQHCNLTNPKNDHESDSDSGDDGDDVVFEKDLSKVCMYS